MTPEQMEAELKQLRADYDAVLRILWEMRGQQKGMYNRIEKELEVPFKDYLERNK